MQLWGLCPGKCQIIKDIEMKSPIAFAYRKGVELETSEYLLRNLDATGERTDEFDELRRRIKMSMLNHREIKIRPLCSVFTDNFQWGMNMALEGISKEEAIAYFKRWVNIDSWENRNEFVSGYSVALTRP